MAIFLGFFAVAIGIQLAIHFKKKNRDLDLTPSQQKTMDLIFLAVGIFLVGLKFLLDDLLVASSD